MTENNASDKLATGKPQAGVDMQSSSGMMVARYYLDIEVVQDTYTPLTQAQRNAAITTILSEVYCPPNMSDIESEWAKPHQLVTVGYNGILEAAHADASRRIEPYLAASCVNQSLSFPGLDGGLDGVSYEIHNGRRRCVITFALADNGGPAIFKGSNGLLARARFRCHVEPLS